MSLSFSGRASSWVAASAASRCARWPAPGAPPGRGRQSPRDRLPAARLLCSTGMYRGRASAHVGIRSRHHLIPSSLGTSLCGLRVSFTGNVKRDAESGLVKEAPSAPPMPAACSPSAPAIYRRPAAMRHHPGSAAGRVASPPDASLPLSPSRRCAALGRITDEHRSGGYADTRAGSIGKRAHSYYHRAVSSATRGPDHAKA